MVCSRDISQQYWDDMCLRCCLVVFFFGSYAWEGWGALPYSMVYNGIYIFAEAAVSVVVILLPPVKLAIGRIRKLAIE